VLKMCEECSYLFIEHTESYNGSYAPKILIFNSEFSDNVLLFDIVILILHIPNALLISATLCSCFHRIDKGICAVVYMHCSQLGYTYTYILYILILYVWHVIFCYGMLHCLCSRLVKLIVIVQAQHINSGKYSNSYTKNVERQLSV
jgi:hypothetical protein